MRTPVPRTPVRVNQIRAFLLERGIAVRQGVRFLRTEFPRSSPNAPRTSQPSAEDADSRVLDRDGASRANDDDYRSQVSTGHGRELAA